MSKGLEITQTLIDRANTLIEKITKVIEGGNSPTEEDVMTSNGCVKALRLKR